MTTTSSFHFAKFLDRVRSNNKKYENSEAPQEIRDWSLRFHLGGYVHSDHPDANTIFLTFDDNHHLLEPLVTKAKLHILEAHLLELCEVVAKETRDRSLKLPTAYSSTVLGTPTYATQPNEGAHTTHSRTTGPSLNPG
jgi:hypothetical protein